MTYIDVDALTEQFTLFRQTVAEEPVVLLAGGKPVALAIGLEADDDPAELERWVRQAWARSAVARIRDRARCDGIDRIALGEIDAEVTAARAERRR